MHGTTIQETTAPRSAPDTSDASPPSAYQPGVCNIGEAEIARRRRAGHVGLAASVGLFTGLLLIRAPAPARLLVALPAVGAASGYLQARFRFCAGFGSRGVYNFDAVGPVTRIEDAEALARDRRRAREIGLASVAMGLAVGALAVVVPG